MTTPSRATGRAFVIAAFAAFALLQAANLRAAGNSRITLTSDGKTLTANGISPGSTAIFFGVAHIPIPRAYMDRVKQFATAVDDADKDGVVTMSLPPDAVLSAWAVVDLRDAKYAIAGQKGFGSRTLGLGNPLRKSNGAVDRFVLGRTCLDLLYVKPGQGAFTWSVIDGTPSDADGPNGAAAIAVQKGKAVRLDGEKPVNFTPGGVLIAIDFTTMEIGAVDIDEALVGGAR